MDFTFLFFIGKKLEYFVDDKMQIRINVDVVKQFVLQCTSTALILGVIPINDNVKILLQI